MESIAKGSFSKVVLNLSTRKAIKIINVTQLAIKRSISDTQSSQSAQNQVISNTPKTYPEINQNDTFNFMTLREQKYAGLVMYEIEVLEKLVHTNIVQFFSSIGYKNNMNEYIFELEFEYTPYKDLFCTLKDKNLFPEIRNEYGNFSHQFIVEHVLKDIASALHYIHSNNIAHRDIKPHNILLFKTNDKEKPFTLKLTDFGFACDLDDTSPKNSRLCGTPYYMAPEVLLLLDNKRTDTFIDYTKLDIWSLGICLFQLYYDRFPFPSSIKNLNQLVHFYKRNDISCILELEIYKYKQTDIKTLLNIIYNCLHIDSLLRPTSSELLQQNNMLFGINDDSSESDVIEDLLFEFEGHDYDIV